MKRTVEDITALQERINDLMLENQVLKNILDRSGISYVQELRGLLAKDEISEYDPNQGARIKWPKYLTREMVDLVFERFQGRLDVYAKRFEKKTGEAGYPPQCFNFWKDYCPIKQRRRISCINCEYKDFKPLTKAVLTDHLLGRSYNASDVIGVYPLLPNGTCRFLVYDFDNHEKNAEKKDYANSNDQWIEEVEAMRKICVLNGIDPLVERSRSGKGAHIWIFFDQPIEAAVARRFGIALLNKGAEQVNLKSFKYYDRLLPAQDYLRDNGLGNLIALPLQGKALRDGNSAFVDSNWNAYPDQWEVLWRKPRLSKEFVELKIREWSNSVFANDLTAEDEIREKPWEKEKGFNASDVDGVFSIALSTGIFIDCLNLKPTIQNSIRRMALISNTEYYKNQAIGLSNFSTERWLYLGKDHLDGYIEIPRGLMDALAEKLNSSGIPYEISDERQVGRQIKVSFSGELREEQKPALNEMAMHDTGILHAATAFGKTVVCSAIIAEKKVNTLIILESSSLIEQWIESLNKFLNIDEPFPEYKTKTGRTRIRKSLIGWLQGAHDSMTGIVDIAMAGSLCKKGEFHPLLSEYGMVIVDECHHAAADTISSVLQKVNSKYVYGVTATPKRGDGLESINYMLLGPIRYAYTAKDKARDQGIAHLVYPRFTRTVSPRGVISEKMHPNEAYEILRNNEVRDEQIAADVKECVESGRTPVVLSKYKDHAERLFERVNTYADHVFLMTGNNSKKEHKQILEELKKVEPSESIILVATGSLIGEGFDYPRLDTLIMATPVSFRGVVEQYAGRLNRDYEGKEKVVVFDYVDSHIPMFDNMYAKRLKAYKQIGYEVCTGLERYDPGAEAIFDGETYLPVFKKDLLKAVRNIIISSPVISATKIRELCMLLLERQKQGVTITVVTWEPDSYGFGDAGYWMQLHEEMRQAGIYVKTAEDSCEHFAVIDSEIVWYGNINLLGKSKVDDSIMRVPSKMIAAELMELMFG